MKKNLLHLITALLFLILAAGVQAKEAETMDHSAMAGMEMGDDVIMLPTATVNGVKAMAHLKDSSKAMAEAGMNTTHHLMISFTDVTTGKALDSGVVAIKVVDPAGKKQKAVKMMAMEGSFGVDVTLSQKGKYVFEVGTKLGDGEKRQFVFDYMVK